MTHVARVIPHGTAQHRPVQRQKKVVAGAIVVWPANRVRGRKGHIDALLGASSSPDIGLGVQAGRLEPHLPRKPDFWWRRGTEATGGNGSAESWANSRQVSGGSSPGSHGRSGDFDGGVGPPTMLDGPIDDRKGVSGP